MKEQHLNRLLLKTGFSCMACDGHIDDREVKLILSLSEEKKMFGDLNTNLELKTLVTKINEKGTLFLKEYLEELCDSNLSEEEELKVINTSISVIEADEKVEYSEIKFFKIIRSKLKISDENILKIYPGIEEFLEEDIISESYLSGLHDDYFSNFVKVNFENVHLDNLE